MTRQVHRAAATASDGTVSTDDGRIRTAVRAAREAERSDDATSPEHIMAAALASCLLQSVTVAGSSQHVDTSGASVEATVTLESGEGSGYVSAFELALTGLDGDVAERVLEQATQICPFTKALDGRRLTVPTG